MYNWITLDLDLIKVVLFTFVTFILWEKINISWRLKLLFGIKISKEVKLLDCFPCATFWITLIGTFNPIIAMTTYLFAVLIDRKNV